MPAALFMAICLFTAGAIPLLRRDSTTEITANLQSVIAALSRGRDQTHRRRSGGDDSYFRGPPFGASWTWDDLQNYYGAPVSALTIEDNVIDLVFKAG